MKNKQNLHTHSTFCDGADTPEEILECAIEKGFDSIGFSGHSYMTYSDFVSKADRTEEYKRAIRELKPKYADRIRVYLGLEVDMYSEPDMTGYDYLIGAVHYLKKDGVYIGFDRREKECIEQLIDNHFGGNGMDFAKLYYETLAELPEYGKFDIIGHFDLVTKHIENERFFDIDSKEYLEAAFEAAEALAGKIPFFEVNTGAIARGYRTSPYPSIPILKRLRELGYGAVISSDCHRMEMLDCCFDEARELLIHCGYKERYILTDSGFEAVGI